MNHESEDLPEQQSINPSGKGKDARGHTGLRDAVFYPCAEAAAKASLSFKEGGACFILAAGRCLAAAWRYQQG